MLAHREPSIIFWAKAPGRTAFRIVNVAFVVPSEMTIGSPKFRGPVGAFVTHSAQYHSDARCAGYCEASQRINRRTPEMSRYPVLSEMISSVADSPAASFFLSRENEFTGGKATPLLTTGDSAKDREAAAQPAARP